LLAVAGGRRPVSRGENRYQRSAVSGGLGGRGNRKNQEELYKQEGPRSDRVNAECVAHAEGSSKPERKMEKRE